MNTGADNSDRDGLDDLFIRNASAIFSVEFVWGFGMPCCAIAVVIPMYLLSIGASKTMIQCVVALQPLLTFLQLYSTRLHRGRRRKLKNIAVWCLFSFLWIIYGAVALCFWPLADSGTWVVLFAPVVIALVSLQNIGSPVYSGLAVENIPPKRRGLAAGLRGIGFGIAGLIGVIVPRWIVKEWPEPDSFHVRFIVGGTFFLLSCAPFLWFRDVISEDDCASGNEHSGFDVLRVLFANLNFRVFVLFYALTAAALLLAPLLIAYGQDILRFDAMERERFVLAYACGLLSCGVFVPLLADRYGFRLIAIIGSMFLMAGFALPIAAPRSPLALLVAYALYSASWSIQIVILANLGYELVPGVRPATIVAAGSVLILPIGLVMGPLGGRLADLFGESGYLAVFAVGITLSAIAALGYLLLVREPRTGQEIYVRLRKI
jgi:Na+/melibiose symporter-like transporter